MNIDFSIDLDNSTNFKLTKIDVVIHLGEKSDPNITLEESLNNIRSSINYINHSIKIGVKHFIAPVAIEFMVLGKIILN